MNRLFTILLMNTLLFGSAYGVEKERNGGPYVGGGFGVSSYDAGGYFNSVDTKLANSYNIDAGAYINKYLSVELGYMKSKDFKTISSSMSEKSFNYSAITISAMAHYPIWYDSFDIYLKFGAGQSFTTLSSSDGSAMVVGAGMSYRIDDMFAIKAAYDLYKFNYTTSTGGGYEMNLGYAYAGVEVQF